MKNIKIDVVYDFTNAFFEYIKDKEESTKPFFDFPLTTSFIKRSTVSYEELTVRRLRTIWHDSKPSEKFPTELLSILLDTILIELNAESGVEKRIMNIHSIVSQPEITIHGHHNIILTYSIEKVN